jgi:hypothetical protein
MMSLVLPEHLYCTAVCRRDANSIVWLKTFPNIFLSLGIDLIKIVILSLPVISTRLEQNILFFP